MIRKYLAVISCALFLLNGIFAQSQGEKLFKENNPADAVQVLENEISNGIVSENSYNFLGLSYYQLGEYEKSIKAFQRGIDVQPGNLKILSFNQGNSYFALKEYNSAVECYSRALQVENDFYEALLNRANSLLMGNKLKSSRSDYAQFLEKNPDNAQSEQIRQLIAAIDEEIARRAEEERLERERERARWEQIDGRPEETYYGPDGAEWERVDFDLEESQYQKRGANWEQIDAEKVSASLEEENVEEEKVSLPEWEKVDGVRVEEPVDFDGEDDKAFWESIDEKERELLKSLDAQGVEEYKRRKEYLMEQARLEAEKNGSLSKEDEEALRKKRLDDLANSLQKTDVNNVSSGADDLIEYEMEGELD
ncbi:MAG: tetratricopeptide repeat protein [Treponema sp.]|nr:tetratricopeptide repeat protein [Treponema sp.]